MYIIHLGFFEVDIYPNMIASYNRYERCVFGDLHADL